MAEKKHEGHKHVDDRKKEPARKEHKGEGHMPHMSKAVAHLNRDKDKFEHARSHKER